MEMVWNRPRQARKMLGKRIDHSCWVVHIPRALAIDVMTCYSSRHAFIHAHHQTLTHTTFILCIARPPHRRITTLFLFEPCPACSMIASTRKVQRIMLFLTHHGELFQIVASITPACKFIQPWLHKWWRGCRWWWHGTHVKFVVATLLLSMIWTVNRATLLRFLCRKRVCSLTDEEGPFPGDRAFSVASYVHAVDKTYPPLRVLVITWNCLVTIGPSQDFKHSHGP